MRNEKCPLDLLIRLFSNISVKRWCGKCGLQWTQEEEIKTEADVRNLAEVRNKRD